MPEQPEACRFWLGRLGQDMTEEGVLAVRRLEPTPVLEIHIHGGREVSRFLLELFLARGISSLSWEAMLRESETDSLRCQAAAELARTTTVRTAGIVLDQYQGAFAAAVQRTAEQLRSGQSDQARAMLGELLRHADVGLHLTTPWRIVVAGAPNVGKSSLVNALAGYQRSIVAPTPGTTRDVVTTQLAIDGWPVELVDTAGLRSDGEALEAMGIEQARAAAAAADLVLWLVDASTAHLWPGERPARLHLIVNKIDLPPAWDLAEAGEALRISAATGEGVPELVRALGDWLVPDPPMPGTAVPFTQSLIERLREVERLLQSQEEGAIGRAACSARRLSRRDCFPFAMVCVRAQCNLSWPFSLAAEVAY